MPFSLPKICLSVVFLAQSLQLFAKPTEFFIETENGTIQPIELEHASTHLENQKFKIVPSTGTAVTSKENIFQGNSPSETNQIQAYYLANKVFGYLSQYFDDPHTGEQITVVTDDLIYGNPNNALFTLKDDQPIIHLGKGDTDNFRSFALSTDFMAHELAHYFLDAYFDSHIGEQGVLQEGLADVLSYSISQDGYFGDDISKRGHWLRSAFPVGRFDNPNNSQDIHTLGQYLSAALFDFLKQEGFDKGVKILAKSVRENSSKSIKGLFYRMLANADETDAACKLVEPMIRYGLVQYIDPKIGDACNQNIENLSQLSRKNYVFDASKMEISFFDFESGSDGPGCGTLGEKFPTSQGYIIFLFLLPLILIRPKGILRGAK